MNKGESIEAETVGKRLERAKGRERQEDSRSCAELRELSRFKEPCFPTHKSV